MEKQPDTLPLRVPAGYAGPGRSIILAGGGMRLAYQAGVLKALEEHDLQFTHGDGTSGGIMNLAMLLSGLSVDDICRNWRTIRIQNFVSYLPLRKYFNPFRIPAFGDADGIVAKVFPHLGINVASINAEQQLQGTFNVCNYSRKTIEAIPQDKVTLNHLIAGISLPIFMPAISIDNDWYIDAVWIKDANLMEAVRRGSEEIWLLWAIGNVQEYKNGSFNQYVHMIEMSANGALFAEFDYINELNKRIANGDSPYGQKQPIKVHVLKPEYPLPLDTDLYFNKINTVSLVEQGYADGKKYLTENNGGGASLSPEATKMVSQGIAFSCRAKLRGVLLGQEVVLHLTFTIHDIYKFLDTKKPYLLTGSISSESQDKVWYGYDGVMALRSSHGKNQKEVCLLLHVKLEEQDYFLEVKVPMDAKSLKKNRTAEVRLYEGRSSAGALVAAAPFTATLQDRLYTLKSLSFYNTRNWLEKRKARKALANYFFD